MSARSSSPITPTATSFYALLLFTNFQFPPFSTSQILKFAIRTCCGVLKGNNCRATKGDDASRVAHTLARLGATTRFRDVYRAAWREAVESRVESRLFPRREDPGNYAHIPQMPKVDAIAGKRRRSRIATAGVLRRH